MLVLLPRLEHRQLRPARRRTSSCAEIRATLRPGDALLLGADLVKPERELLLAYDDPLGVTAAFNKNLLVRINRELGGDFDLDAFAHRRGLEPDADRASRCTWSAGARRPSASRRRDDGAVRSGRVDLDRELLQVRAGADPGDGCRGRFSPPEQWIDRDAGFALTLLIAV